VNRNETLNELAGLGYFPSCSFRGSLLLHVEEAVMAEQTEIPFPHLSTLRSRARATGGMMSLAGKILLVAIAFIMLALTIWMVQK